MLDFDSASAIPEFLTIHRYFSQRSHNSWIAGEFEGNFSETEVNKPNNTLFRARLGIDLNTLVFCIYVFKPVLTVLNRFCVFIIHSVSVHHACIFRETNELLRLESVLFTWNPWLLRKWSNTLTETLAPFPGPSSSLITMLTWQLLVANLMGSAHFVHSQNYLYSVVDEADSGNVSHSVFAIKRDSL